MRSPSHKKKKSSVFGLQVSGVKVRVREEPLDFAPAAFPPLGESGHEEAGRREDVGERREQ